MDIELCQMLITINQNNSFKYAIESLQKTSHLIVEQLKAIAPQQLAELTPITEILNQTAVNMDAMLYDFWKNFTGNGPIASELQKSAAVLRHLDQDSPQLVKLEHTIAGFNFHPYEDAPALAAMHELAKMTFDKYADQIEVCDLPTVDRTAIRFPDVETGFYYASTGSRRVNGKENIILIIKTDATTEAPGLIYMRGYQHMLFRYYHPYEDQYIAPSAYGFFHGLAAEFKKHVRIAEEDADIHLYNFDADVEIANLIAQAKDLFIHEKLLDEHLETTSGAFVRDNNENARLEVNVEEHLHGEKKQVLGMTLLLNHDLKSHTVSCSSCFTIRSICLSKPIHEINQEVLKELIYKMRDNMDHLQCLVEDRIMELNADKQQGLN